VSAPPPADPPPGTPPPSVPPPSTPPPSVPPPFARPVVAEPPRRRLWPWVVGGVGIVVLGLFAVAAMVVGWVVPWLFDDPYEVTDWADANPHRAARDTSTLPLLERHPCPFASEPDAEGVTCATLVVPADRTTVPSDPAPDDLVELAVAILDARGPGPTRPDPIVYLEGGPGGASVAWFDLWAVEGWPSDRDRDLILIDQRGTGYSTPSLGCDDVVWAEPGEQTAALRGCHDAWVAAGIDLATVSTPAHASDVADLRVALGIEEWNLFGVSYGTRVALRVLSDHPEGVRSAVLDSVYPPEVEALLEEIGNGVAAFDALFAACAAEPACARTHGDLAATFATLIDEFDRDPVDLGDDLVVTGDELVAASYAALYDPELLGDLPAHLTAAAEDPAAIGELFDAVWWGHPPHRRDTLPATVPAFEDSDGTFYSVECREEAATIDAQDALGRARAIDHAAAPALTRILEETLAVCDGWRSGRADPRERDRVISDVPTLLLAGALDPVTPPTYAERAAAGLTAGQLVVFPAVGHAVVLGGDCPHRLATTFLVAPEAPVDAACSQMFGPFSQ
jgi:pimeloyl-ACP methyl ester carboxylesterase